MRNIFAPNVLAEGRAGALGRRHGVALRSRMPRAVAPGVE